MLEPEDGIGAIGSGGIYAQSAAKALQENTELSPAEIVQEVADHRRPAVHLHQPVPHHRNAGLNRANSIMNMTPLEIVSELDKHVVGQGKAKRAVAIALRNRWRRQQVEPSRCATRSRPRTS